MHIQWKKNQNVDMYMFILWHAYIPARAQKTPTHKKKNR